MERHLLSLSHSALERYDVMMEQLLEPEVQETAEAFSAALQRVFKIYCSMDEMIAFRWPPSETKPPWDGGSGWQSL